MLENLGEVQGFLAKVCEDTPLCGGGLRVGMPVGAPSYVVGCGSSKFLTIPQPQKLQ